MRAQQLLVVEGDPDRAARFLGALAHSPQIQAEWVETLAEAVDRVRTGPIAAVALNLHLSDSRGLDTLTSLLRAAPSLPVLVLCGPADEDEASSALEQGAQDYLLHDLVNRFTLTRAVSNMIVRKTLEESLYQEKERASVTLDSIGDAVLSVDNEGHVTYLNLVAESMTGWSRADAIGLPVADVFHIINGLTHKVAPSPTEFAIRENRTVELAANSVLVRKDGTEAAIEDSAAPIHDRAGQTTGAVVVFHDVTASRDMTQQMSYLAHHDSLTDLPNRVLIQDRLTQAIALARRHGHRVAVLFLDMDRFKQVNDSFGHGVGDQLLRQVAERLKLCVRQSDTVGRQGGDEFVVLLPELEHDEDAGISGARILAAMAEGYMVADTLLYVPVSIGASVYPTDGETADILLSNADTAMYSAKKRGRNNCQFFRHEMNVLAAERQFIEAGLRRALQQHEFSLAYQPKVNLKRHEIIGVEALLRWRHPQRGFIAPAEFVPVAEDSGLIVPIGRWVLREACRQAREWADDGLGPVSVAINVSALEFRSRQFLSGVQNILHDTRLDAGLLEMELTETALMQHSESVSALRSLKNLGIRLAIDDFGTGYSSLSYLQEFPIDALKVDQSFVHRISADPEDAGVLRAVLGMGKSMNKRVIAEGVETRAQLEFLEAHDCEEGQGYYFHPPMLPDRFAALMEADSKLCCW